MQVWSVMLSGGAAKQVADDFVHSVQVIIDQMRAWCTRVTRIRNVCRPRMFFCNACVYHYVVCIMLSGHTVTYEGGHDSISFIWLSLFCLSSGEGQVLLGHGWEDFRQHRPSSPLCWGSMCLQVHYVSPNTVWWPKQILLWAIAQQCQPEYQ